MKKIKVISVFGTRPEAIKMSPLVKALEEYSEFFESKVIVTAQHREMLDQVLEIFDIKPDYDLNIMKHNQTLADVTGSVVKGVCEILKKERPDLLLVHGDTTTTFSAALAAFYNQVKIGHIEAGLRSGNKYSPFPEEMNRTLTGRLCDYHFSPTIGNKKNLIKENIDKSTIFITGNTVIDALMSVVDESYIFNDSVLDNINFKDKRIILLTAHRRENLGEPMRNIFYAVKQLVEEFKNIEIIYPMHLNPKVRQPAIDILGGIDRVHLIEPLEYVPFANLISKVYLVMTDSGGIQEEAPALGKPVLVLRRETERPEAVEAGTVKIVGTEKDDIFNEASKLLKNENLYNEMANAVNPYGNGTASKKIVEIIKGHMINK